MNNNEKKVITISLNKFLAIVACLIIVGFVGINIYANSLGKPNIISGIEALIKDEPEVNVDDIAKELFEKGAYEIRYLEHSSLKKDYEIVEPLVRKEINGKAYFKTKEKYEKVEQKYGEIFTEEALENVLAMRFADVDGVLYVSEGGATGTGFENVEVEKISEENGKLTYKAFYNDVAVTGDVSEEKYNCEFEIKEVNGEYRISATDYYNLDAIEEKNNNSTESNVNYEGIISTTLGEKDVFFVTEVRDNGNDAYTLNGVIYEHDDNNYDEAEISDNWILTDKYYSITVSKKLPCSMKYDYEGKYHTVEDVFSNYENVIPTNTSNPYYVHSFTFVFENGECVGVENVLTGLESINNESAYEKYNDLYWQFKENCATELEFDGEKITIENGEVYIYKNNQEKKKIESIEGTPKYINGYGEQTLESVYIITEEGTIWKDIEWKNGFSGYGLPSKFKKIDFSEKVIDMTNGNSSIREVEPPYFLLSTGELINENGSEYEELDRGFIKSFGWNGRLFYISTDNTISYYDYQNREYIKIKDLDGKELKMKDAFIQWSSIYNNVVEENGGVERVFIIKQNGELVYFDGYEKFEVKKYKRAEGKIVKEIVEEKEEIEYGGQIRHIRVKFTDNTELLIKDAYENYFGI